MVHQTEWEESFWTPPVLWACNRTMTCLTCLTCVICQKCLTTNFDDHKRSQMTHRPCHLVVSPVKTALSFTGFPSCICIVCNQGQGQVFKADECRGHLLKELQLKRSRVPSQKRWSVTRQHWKGNQKGLGTWGWNSCHLQTKVCSCCHLFDGSDEARDELDGEQMETEVQFHLSPCISSSQSCLSTFNAQTTLSQLMWTIDRWGVDVTPTNQTTWRITGKRFAQDAPKQAKGLLDKKCPFSSFSSSKTFACCPR